MRDDDYEVVYCTSYFNKKAGKRIYAHQYGLKAFCFKFPKKRKK
ncbi:MULTISPECIES: hypothetical protein [unclassified Endozoicomonas]